MLAILQVKCWIIKFLTRHQLTEQWLVHLKPSGVPWRDTGRGVGGREGITRREASSFQLDVLLLKMSHLFLQTRRVRTYVCTH